MVGRLICILKASPTADIVDKDRPVRSRPSYNIL